MPADPSLSRSEDLRRWRAQFPRVTAIADTRPRHSASCVGVVHKIRLVPNRALELTIDDGSGRLTAVWRGRTSLPGVALGAGLRVTGTIARSTGLPVMLNPEWELVSEPYR